MKLLAFTDVHGDLKTVKELVKVAKKENPDFLICAGDLSNFGTDLKSLLEEFKGFQLIIIPGNHEEGFALKEVCEKLGFIYLNAGCYELNEYKFFGCGGGGFSTVDRDFENLSEKFKNIIGKNDKVILVTHGPPYGNKVDIVNGENRGCKSYTKFIKDVSPSLCICGHFHETGGQYDTIGRTVIINPGKTGKIIEI